MDDAAHSRELRRQQRFKTRDRVFAVLYTDVLLLGKVVDVSRKGLALQYVTFAEGNGEWDKGMADLEVFENSFSRYWRVPFCSVVYDLEVPLEVRFSYSYQLRRCGIHFGDLSREQYTQVASLIEHVRFDSLGKQLLELPSTGV